MYFCDLEARVTKEIFPGVRIRTFWGEKMLMSVVDLDPNTVVPDHNHEHEQCGTVISGEMALTIGGETRHLKSGDTYLIPSGVDHMARTGEGPARALDVFSPPREAYQY